MGRARGDQPLRIGVIAPPWVSVPPSNYGGTEFVIDQLARGLQERGHEVRLFTTGDSTCPVPRSWQFRHALGTTAHPNAELSHVQNAYAQLRDVDLVHDHTFAGPLWAATSHLRVPVVTTNHGPFIPATKAHFAKFAHRVGVIAISQAQRDSAPDIPIAAVIHHGIDIGDFPVGTGDGDYLLFLGRMSPDKGVHRAIAVARAAGRRLVIAAKMWEPDEHRYFADVVRPMLGEDAEYVGLPTGRRKTELLAGAAALINPIRWPEPFGLVMIESLACGTPVLTFAEGAAPEIVEDGRTGFLCSDEAEMIRRIGQIDDLSRDACRSSAARRFSTDRFVEDHAALYRRVLDRPARLGALRMPTPRDPSLNRQYRSTAIGG